MVRDAIARGKRARLHLNELSNVYIQDAAQRVLAGALASVEASAAEGRKCAVVYRFAPIDGPIAKSVKQLLKDEGLTCRCEHHPETGLCYLIVEWQ